MHCCTLIDLILLFWIIVLYFYCSRFFLPTMLIFDMLFVLLSCVVTDFEIIIELAYFFIILFIKSFDGYVFLLLFRFILYYFMYLLLHFCHIWLILCICYLLFFNFFNIIIVFGFQLPAFIINHCWCIAVAY